MPAVTSDTILHRLHRRAVETPDRLAFRFLPDDDNAEPEVWTCRDLYLRALALADQLTAAGARGERALLVLPSGPEYVAALFGCLLAGVVAVPAYPPRANHHQKRLMAIAADSDARVALVSSRRAARGTLPGVELVTVDATPAGTTWPGEPPAVDPSAVALLQYTSGSTSTAKGVMLTHACLAPNLDAIARRFGHTEDSRGVIWLPPYHDMGLIGGILQPVWCGFPCTLMSSLGFLRRPRRWLEAISRYRATTSGGPNFAYDMVVRQIAPGDLADLDLSCWSVAFVGAEPIRAETLEAFARTFAPAGFNRTALYPCYGLAEGTLMVTGGALDAPPVVHQRDGRLLVGCGAPIPEHQVLVVDPETSRPSAPGDVGEIWVSGPSVAPGYWRNEAETAAVFGGRLADGSGPYLRTGDLGQFIDGELIVTGRLRDLVVIRGVNHYPHDIEATVEQGHAAVRPGCVAAFGVDDDGQTRLAVVAETDLRAATPAEVVRDIRRAVSARHGLDVDIVVLAKRNAVPKTSSGKIQRDYCRRQFLDGTLAAIETWREPREAAAPASTAAPPRLTVEAVESWLVAQIERAGCAPVTAADRERPLVELGLDSLKAVALARAIEDWTGLSLPNTLVWDHPSITALSVEIARRTSAPGNAVAPPPTDPAEPIAVIGLACRLPGAPDVESFWRLLEQGDIAFTDVPPRRWNNDRIFDSTPGLAGKVYTRRGGFLDNVDEFDPYLFGIAPREAHAMDAQQRLLLEVAWEALETSGTAPDALTGTTTGVFVGICNADYAKCQMLFPEHERTITSGTGPGNAFSLAANRLSYVLDLHGPSLAVDTACSSSLVAVHLACHSLRAGESSLAIVGGVNLMLAPETTIALSSARMLSPSESCRPFDDRADGYVRGEGCAVLVLKRLSEALRDRDRIRAVIRGTAVNQDGRTNGLTAPNGRAQEAVIHEALRNAAVAAADISYVEAHGTGTTVGDAIEYQALASTYGDRGDDAPRCVVTSVKANIGHLESAAGVAGLVKAILCLERERIPAQSGFEALTSRARPSPGLVIPTGAVAWPATSRPRLAAVSGFGFGGTNGHVVLGEAPRVERPAPAIDRSAHVLALSAHTATALGTLAQRYAARLQDPVDLAALCSTANAGRSQLAYRAAIVGSDRETMARALTALAEGAIPAETPRPDTKIAFLFPGQGTQYVGMGRELYESSPIVRDIIDACDRVARPSLGLSLVDLLYTAGGPGLHDTRYAQPVLFAIECALAALWQSWGIRPSFVLGHSVGEYAAAVVAGAMRMDDGMRLIAERGRLMGSLPRDGAMAAVAAPLHEVAPLVEAYEPDVSLAAWNGASSVVVSGTRDAVFAICRDLEAQSYVSQVLPVSHAFHSRLMKPMLDDFERCAAAITYSPTRIPLITNVTGDVLAVSGIDGAHWRRHARQTVQFAAGVDTLARLGCRQFLEVGPGDVLSNLGRRHLREVRAEWLSSISGTEGDWTTLLQSLGRLFERGHRVDWHAFDRPYHREPIDAPTMCFEREPFWIQMPDDVVASPAAYEPGGEATGHPLLGRRVPAPAPLYSLSLPDAATSYLLDHRVQGHAVCPAAHYVAVAAAALEHARGEREAIVEGTTFLSSLVLRSDRVAHVQISLQATGLGEFAFCVGDGATEAGGETTYARGRLRRAGARTWTGRTLTMARTSCAEPVDVLDFYAALAARGLEYGPRFQGVRALWRGDGQSLARIEVSLADASACEQVPIHPILLDAALQAVAGAVGPDPTGDSSAWVPVAIDEVRLGGRLGRSGWAHAVVQRLPEAQASAFSADIALYSETGDIAGAVLGLRLQRIAANVQPRRVDATLAYDIAWTAVPLNGTEQPLPADCVVLADGQPLAKRVAARLRGKGYRTVVVQPGAQSGGGVLSASVDHTDTTAYERFLDSVLPDGFTPGLVVDFVPPPLEAESPADAAAANAQRAFALLQALLRRDVTPRLAMVTRSAAAVLDGDRVEPTHGPLAGLMRVAAHECPQLRPLRIDVASGADTDDAAAIVHELMASTETEVALRGGKRFVPSLRHSAPPAAAGTPRATPVGRGCALSVARPGDIDSLSYTAVRRVAPAAGQIEIEVDATALNFSDVLKVMGLYPSTATRAVLGAECAGRVSRVGDGVAIDVGTPVAAIAPAAFAPVVVTDARLAMRLPAQMSGEERVTIPIAFLTAHLGLNRLARLQRGERVLIHAAAGGVGLAAIQLAQRAGAEVFATAGTPEKRSFLEYLGIPHVFDSRTLDFVDQVREVTGGEGVDVVLNSLADEFIPASLSLLRSFGRFVELGKTNIYAHAGLSLGAFRRSLSFFAVDLDRLSQERPDVVGDMIAELEPAFANRELRPLPRRVFPAHEPSQAFRYLAQRKNIGKVLLAFDRAVSADTFPSAGTVLITGGLGTLGLRLAATLARHGVTDMALVGRSEPSAEVRARLADLDGVRVRVFQGDVASERSLQAILEDIDRSMPPLKAVVHAAGILRDRAIANLSPAEASEVLAPKIRGAWNLHTLTRGRAIEHFVLFSSAAAVLGSPGQSAYAAANGFLDALAASRRAAGLPALSVAWGPFAAAAGMVRPGVEARLRSKGVRAIADEEGMELLAAMMTGAAPSADVVIDADWSTLARAYGAALPPTLLRDLMGSQTHDAAAPVPSAAAPADLTRADLAALSPAQRTERLSTYLRAQICRLTDIPVERIDPHATLNGIGVDSLTLVELRTRTEGLLGIRLPLSVLAHGASVATLVQATLDEAFATPAMTEARSEATATDAGPEPTNVNPFIVSIRIEGPHAVDELAAAWDVVLDKHELMRRPVNGDARTTPPAAGSIWSVVDTRSAAEAEQLAREWADSARLPDHVASCARLFHRPDGPSTLVVAVHPRRFDAASRHLLLAAIAASVRQVRAEGRQTAGVSAAVSDQRAESLAATSVRAHSVLACPLLDDRALEALQETAVRDAGSSIDDYLGAACATALAEHRGTITDMQWVVSTRTRETADTIGAFVRPVRVTLQPRSSPLDALTALRAAVASREPASFDPAIPVVLCDAAPCQQRVGATRLILQPPQGVPSPWCASLNVYFVETLDGVRVLVEREPESFGDAALDRWLRLTRAALDAFDRTRIALPAAMAVGKVAGS